LNAHLRRFRDWWMRLDIKVRVGYYLIAAFLLVIGLPSGAAEVAAATAKAPPQASVSGPVPTGPIAVPVQDAAKTIRVYDMASRTVQPVALNQYVENVLAAQMSPTSPMNALEAAAVVIRTYAVRAINLPAAQSREAQQQHADVSTSPVTDLAWLTELQQQNQFKGQYNADVHRLQEAVSLTDGIVLTYKRQPIVAFLTAASAGETRQATTSLGKNLPYLKAVKCPADANSAALVQTRHFTAAQLAADLNLSAKTTHQQGFLQSFTVTARDAQGYALQVQSQGHSWTGQDFAARLGLPSPHMALKTTHSTLVVTTKGLGLGYGMSLHQAVAWAKIGQSWQALLHTFYPGAQIQSDAT